MEQHKRTHLIHLHKRWTILKTLLVLKRYEEIDGYLYEIPEHHGSLQNVLDGTDLPLLESIQDYIATSAYSLALADVDQMLDLIRHSLTKTRCNQTWDGLTLTSHQGIRFCSECKKNVYLANTEEELKMRAQLGQCVALIQELEIYEDKSLESDKPFCKLNYYHELLGDPDFSL